MIGKTPVAIDQPVRFGVDGGLVITRDVNHQIYERLLAIIATNPSERVMLPDFGVGVNRMVFEPSPEQVTAALSVDVNTQAARYEPGAKITRLDPRPNAERGEALLDIGFQRTDTPASPTNGARYVHRGVTGPGGMRREVLRG
ncbi:GPW/gp25 family protein [Nonomuraea typhae]|uniref:GPW/gp25 family protein n=1 Tax=Nonomuraea typhae TaxID=2603600 RepID=A0ABW7YKN1_9ACTN